MSDVTDFLFGGGGGVETKTVPKWSPEQMDLFNLYTGRMRGLYGTNAPVYPGRMSLGITPDEETYFRAFEPGSAKALWTGTLLPEFRRQWSEEIAPAIREEHAGPGYYGSPRMEDVSRAASEHEAGMRTTYGNLMYNEEMARREALKERASLSREIGLAGLQEQMWRWMQGEEVDGVSNPYNSPWFEHVLQLLNLDPYYVIGGYDPGQQGFLQSMAPGAGYAAGKFLFKP